MTRRQPIPGVLDVDARAWRTPLTGVVASTDNARLVSDTYARGFYRFEGTMGPGGRAEFYRVHSGRLPLTLLQRRDGNRWKTWMLDDPLHWFGMAEAVDALPSGPVLVAGLGLGLFAHHIVNRDDIPSVTVVELDPDVIDLVRPTLPDDDRINIVEGNFYTYLRQPGLRPFSGVLWDLAVGDAHDVVADFYIAAGVVARHLPDAELVMFGQRRDRG